MRVLAGRFLRRCDVWGPFRVARILVGPSASRYDCSVDCEVDNVDEGGRAVEQHTATKGGRTAAAKTQAVKAERGGVTVKKAKNGSLAAKKACSGASIRIQARCRGTGVRLGVRRRSNVHRSVWRGVGQCVYGWGPL
ncbi:hypothetical protein AAVH_10785 [Aphelenchoides avenae]|nr:hypothetical protein AAVH_10785 [Aphelenchus avenae]